MAAGATGRGLTSWAPSSMETALGRVQVFQLSHPSFSGLHISTMPYLLGLLKWGQDWGSIQMPESVGNISHSKHHTGSLLNGFLTPHSSYRAKSSTVSFSHEPFRGYCFGPGMMLHRGSLWWAETAQVMVGIQRERERQEEMEVPGFPSMAWPYWTGLLPRPHLFKLLPYSDSARLEVSLPHMGLWKYLRSRLSQKWNNESAFLREMVAPWRGGSCFWDGQPGELCSVGLKTQAELLRHQTLGLSYMKEDKTLTHIRWK